MMSDPLSERVAFVTRDILSGAEALGTGFQPDPDDRTYRTIREAIGFDSRHELEDEPSRKQIIPYVVLFAPDGIFAMRRKRKQTETRLHDLWSIGVGGHIPDDLAGEEDLLRAGMERELHEEVHLRRSPRVAYRGTLNDDSNEVGRVHLGLVFSGYVNPEDVEVRETNKIEGWWTTVEDLRAESERLESWSEFLLPHLETWQKDAK